MNKFAKAKIFAKTYFYKINKVPIGAFTSITNGTVSKTSNYKESLLWFKIRRSPIKYNANGLKTNLLWPHRYTYIGIVHTEIGVAKSIINNTIN